MDSLILSILIFLPVFGAAIMLPASKYMGRDKPEVFKYIALFVTGLQLVFSAILYWNFDPTLSVVESPFTVQVDWIKAFNIQYFIGVDGLSMPMVILTALLSFICIVVSWV